MGFERITHKIGSSASADLTHYLSARIEQQYQFLR